MFIHIVLWRIKLAWDNRLWKPNFIINIPHFFTFLFYFSTYPTVHVPNFSLPKQQTLKIITIIRLIYQSKLAYLKMARTRYLKKRLHELPKRLQLPLKSTPLVHPHFNPNCLDKRLILNKI